MAALGKYTLADTKGQQVKDRGEVDEKELEVAG